MKAIAQLCLLIGTLMVQPIPSDDPNITAYCVEYQPEPNTYKTGVVMLVSKYNNQFPLLFHNRSCRFDKGEKK